MRSADDEALWEAMLARLYDGDARLRLHRLLGDLEKVRYWRCVRSGEECSDELLDLRDSLGGGGGGGGGGDSLGGDGDKAAAAAGDPASSWADDEIDW